MGSPPPAAPAAASAPDSAAPAAASAPDSAAPAATAPDSAAPASAQVDRFIDVEIRDFGPVSSASIRLSPLTVLVGPNNSGKSYIALLLHSIIAEQARLPSLSRRGGAAPACRDIVRGAYDGGRKRALLGEAESGEFAAALLANSLRSALRRGIKRNLGSPLGSLVRSGRDRSTIAVLESGLTGRPRLDIAIGRQGGDLEVSAGYRGGGPTIEASHKSARCTVGFAGGGAAGTGPAGGGGGGGPVRATYLLPRDRLDRPGEPIGALSRVLARAVALRMRRSTAYNRSIYFPAGRSAIMGMHHATFVGIVESASSKELVKSLAVPGTIAVFVGRLLDLECKKGEFFGLASRMEREVLSGNVRLADGAPDKPNTISYRFDGMSVPLSRAASSASELAPISLYLKHAAVRGNVLIIEEPDAGLHPASAVVLAKHIVRLVRRGLYVVLTTHSPYLLEKLGKYLLASKLPADERADGLGYGRDDYLEPGDVSAYLLKKGRDGGYSSVEIGNDDEAGISQEDLVKVDLDLSEETALIHSRTGGG